MKQERIVIDMAALNQAESIEFVREGARVAPIGNAQPTNTKTAASAITEVKKLLEHLENQGVK